MSYPYLAKTTLKYKSPHPTDLSFAKDETIRVTGPSPDDEDWLVGELLDGSKSGGFPKDFIVVIDDESGADAVEPVAAASPPPAQNEVKTEEAPATTDEPPVPVVAPAPPSPKLEPAELPEATPEPTPAPTPAPAAAPKPAEPAPASDEASSPPRQSMKERLAFFAAAQNKVAPPPPIKPKPAAGGLTWSQRQKLRQEQEAKEAAERTARGEDAPAPVESASAAPSASTSESTPAPKPDERADKSAGMSASDAVSSIGQGGSLKERMAALRAGGAFGAPAEEKQPAPIPSGKTWTRPPAPPAPEAEDDAEAEEGMPERVKSPAEDDAAAQPSDDGDKEETEEEKEKARRAAIAARMAKLGARGPMGMAPPAPPKPARKPTLESVKSPPAEERPEPTLPPATEQAEPVPESAATESPAPSPAQPTSIPIAAVPRRAAPPRRRGAAAATTAAPTPETARNDPAEGDKRFEKVGPDGAISPPPQVMVADEEAPIPKTEEQLALEKQHEEAARGEQGAEGAAAAGIALAPAFPESNDSEDGAGAPLVGALGNAASDSRGVGTIADREGGEIKLVNDEPVQEIEDGLEEGGAEKDDILEQAAAGRLDLRSPAEEHASPQPVEVVPIHPPAPSGPPSDADDNDDAPPPPPPRHGMTDFPQDEVERKHDHDAQHAAESDQDDTPAPPPHTTRLGSNPPLGPRPLPSLGPERSLPPPPMGNPLVPPRDESEDERELGGEGDVEDEDIPPPPPRRQGTIPSSPVAATRPPVQPTEDDEDAGGGNDDPAPPPPKRESTILPPAVPSNREAGERILADNEEAAPAPPPRRQPTAPTAPVPPPPASDEDQDDAPLPPPARKPTLPPPIRTASTSRPSGPDSPSSPKVTRSPSHIRSPSSQAPPSPFATTHDEPSAPTEEDEEKTRRSGIASRMAKLGGIKFGMPPPVPRKSFTTSNQTSAEVETPQSPLDEDATPRSPIATEHLPSEAPSAEHAAPSAPVDDDDESPEAQAARRRATLARLRAGGALGFGMFNHGPAAESEEDARGLVAEEPKAEEDEAPPAPPPRAPPVELTDAEEEENVAPPPPPPTRPVIPTPAAPPPAVQPQESDDAPPPPVRPIRTSMDSSGPIAPGSPVRSPSGRRPPIPAADRRLSGQLPPSPSLASRTSEPVMRWDITEEPAVMMMSQEEAAPQNRTAQSSSIPPAQSPPLPPAHQRSASTASRVSRSSRLSADVQSYSPTMRQAPAGHGLPNVPPPQHEQPLPPTPSDAAPKQSMSASAQRPGYDTLVHASKDSGARLARAARAMFDQGKKAYYGDGSPTGFVLIALDNAHVARPLSGWGQLVYEQEASSVLKRYDEPRAGDIAAFHDAKLKGRKGLSGYEQHVGSVEEPLLGIVVDFEVKNKHKVKVLQVERGVPEEVSYRLDDLKTGWVAIYRPGL